MKSSLSPEQLAEIAAARTQSNQTRRPTVPALEEILYEALPVLDHGFVRVIDYFGDDAAICAIAIPRPSRCARSSCM